MASILHFLKSDFPVPVVWWKQTFKKFGEPEIIVIGDFVSALKSLCTQEIHRFKEQKSFSASHLLLSLWELRPNKVLHLLSLVSFLPSFFSLKGGVIQFKSFQLCYFILSWDFYRKSRDSEQLLNKVNSLNYTVISTKSNDGDIDGLNFLSTMVWNRNERWKHRHFVKF